MVNGRNSNGRKEWKVQGSLTTCDRWPAGRLEQPDVEECS